MRRAIFIKVSHISKLTTPEKQGIQCDKYNVYGKREKQIIFKQCKLDDIKLRQLFGDLPLIKDIFPSTLLKNWSSCSPSSIFLCNDFKDSTELDFGTVFIEGKFDDGSGGLAYPKT